MDWQGIRRDNAATGDGAYLIIGADMDTLGEIGRRPGMAQGPAQSGVVLTSMWSPSTGRFVIYATATGDVVAEAV